MIEARESRPIFLDHHSTTPLDPRIAEVMIHWMTVAYGNPHSVDHVYGDEAARAVEQARAQVAALIHCAPRQVIFTSGATEAINCAIRGYIQAVLHRRDVVRIGLSPLEHSAVLETCRTMERLGFATLRWLPVDSCGRIALEDIEKLCIEGLDLLCVMAVNNEIGNIYPIREIGLIAARHEVPFFCDASQAAGKMPIDFERDQLSFLSLSAHKMYGPKGIGALVVNDTSMIQPILYGGGQEGGIRPGTINVPGVVGMGLACELRLKEMVFDETAIAAKRDHLRDLLMAQVTDIRFNGDLEHKLAGNLHFSVRNIPNDAVIARTRRQLAISTGSACSSGSIEPSHVLRAINMDEDWIIGSLRVCIGKYNSDNDIEEAGSRICSTINAITHNLR